MKYMIMTFGSAAEMHETKSKEWIREMVAFMGTVNDELRERGEWVDAQGLTDPETATVVRWQDGAPVPTDGPFAETKEGLVGYWIVDVADHERAIEIASKVVDFVHAPLEVRRVADGPPEV